ncbi:MAG: hypothetical protein KatS3mg025_0704 [Bacteroidia bacterium]|nr:MAG: hypothetical protein KatS3mg025_0704 [Bacteroidia bacterium]
MKYLLCLAGALIWAQTHRCGTIERLQYLMQQDPSILSRMQAVEEHTRQYMQNLARMPGQRTNNVITIPVVVHIVYRTASENITDAQVQSQIDVLNEDFRRLNADTTNTPSLFAGVAADAEIQFCLATRDPLGNPTTGITRTQTTKTSFSAYADDVKFSSQGGKDAWPTDQYLNIWVCRLSGGVLGYAQFPGSGPASTDGVVIDFRYFGRGGSAQAPYDQGRTATHEVGHWLNLRHIWGDAQCGDDLVNDTPTQEGPNYSCPTFPHPTCGNTSDMFMNYMDYTDDACMNLFTVGQKNRMRAVLSLGGYRYSLLSSLGCSPPGGGCSGTQTLTASSGTFSDGSGTSNYQNNADCRWLIQPSNALSITLSFQSFQLLSGDSVIVYDGSTTSAPRLGAFSGSSLPPSVTSSGGVMLVRFISNGSGVADGFVASYTSQLNLPCYGTQVLTQASGTITDGSGTSDYQDNADCKWVIQPGSGAGIRIEFTQFATEQGYDFVTIYDGSLVNSTYMVRRFSGTNLPSVVTTSIPEATIYFTSDQSITAAGWGLNYTTIAQPYCQGTVQLTAPSGSFSDGSGNSDYTNRADCRWLIQPPGATWVRLSFTSFTTEANYDFVRVYDGPTTSSPLLGSYSGTTLPPTLTSTGGSMLVVFTSDSSITRAGWEATYTSNGTSTALSAESAAEVRFYPTPAHEVLHIELPQPQGGGILTVYDLQGRKAWEGLLQPGNNTLSVVSWASGVYIGVLQQSQGAVVSFRFVKE